MDEIKKRIAPCGLHCGKCFAFIDGDIKRSSVELQNAMGNFDDYAKRFVTLLDEPVFNKYDEFKELLDYFAKVECKGCRNESCKLFNACRVRECYAEKGVDFCFQCQNFPCNDTGFDEHLYRR
jgi:hypothetical protein